MRKVTIILGVCLQGATVFAGDSVTGRWSVAVQPEFSRSGEWQYTVDTNGLPEGMCNWVTACAEVYKITGTATVYYASAGRKFYQAEYVDSVRHGHWGMWYPNGEVLSSGQFHHGDFAGVWKWGKPDGSIRARVDWDKRHALAPSPPTEGQGKQNSGMMAWYADRLVRRGPYPSHLIEPYVVTNASVVGEWGDLAPFMEFTRISVSPPQNGIHTVSIRSSGSLAQYAFTNRATFADGVLRFDSPVCTYRSDPFREAFLVGDPEFPRLFPESELQVLEREIEEQGEAGARRWMSLAGVPRVFLESKEPQLPPGNK